MKKRVGAAIAICVLPVVTARAVAETPEGPPASASVTVTYLANEGFLLSAGETKVLVDALFPGIRHYSTLSSAAEADLHAAMPPFDGVDVVLATHSHDDHFGPREARAFLAASPETVLVTTPQAVARFAEAGGLEPASRARVHAFHPGEGESASFEAKGVSIEILNLHHGRDRRPPIENLGFVIDLGGFLVLHIGDTEASLAEFSPYALASRPLDLALVPGWFVAEPRWIEVTRSLGAAALGIMHLAEPDAPPSWFGSAGSRRGRTQRIRASFPEAWIPRSELESRTFGGASNRR